MATTKEQERQALKKIEKILKELGSESYVVKAFEGCSVIAEQNIESDFFCSMKERAEAAERESAKFGEMWKTASEEIDARNEEIESLKRQIEVKEENTEYWRTRWKENIDNLKAANEKLDGYEKTISEQERTIIELKAKLYDALVK